MWNMTTVNNCKVQYTAVTDRIAPTLVEDLLMSSINISQTVRQQLIETLSLDLSVDELTHDTPLLGNFPEFDSMAIVSVITGLEETFGFTAEDDDLTAEIFETVGSLVAFVEVKAQ